MLSSYQDLNTSRADLVRGNTPPPPLEPMHTPDEHEDGRREEPPPPSAEWFGFQVQGTGSTNLNGDDNGSIDDDDLPSLRSVSSSNDSEDGHANQVESGLDQSETTYELDTRREVDHHWPLFRYLNGTIQISEAPETASASGISSETNTTLAAPSSGRFSTVVDREETRVIIDVDDDDNGEVEDTSEDEVESEDNVDSELIDPLSVPTSTSSEPPFVTDGRGRVVWSSSTVNKTIQHHDTYERAANTMPPSSPSRGTDTPCLASHSSPPSPALTIQLHDESRVLPIDGFTTDGRGRVINIGSGNDEEFQPPALLTPAPPRSFLGRMFDALF